ncbi:histone acetyltransferase subunit NuA4-domain-containing protein [Lipomyces arxii]|uniref:histone acetyltransferase subunit NuA4-domain-containing protein n=1 Tax=Lipomyces arxii TaxID=56418 RepID=UPI0034CD813A
MPDPSQIASGEQPQVDKQELAQYEKLRKELRDLLSRKKAIDKNLSYIEENIFKFEGAYLEDTPNGNIIKGFDNYLKAGSTGSTHGNSSSMKKKATFTDYDRLFSLSSATYLKVCRVIYLDTLHC